MMEFWIGLSVGMHLGKVMADYLVKIIEAYGLLDAEAVHEIQEIEEVESQVGSIIDAVSE